MRQVIHRVTFSSYTHGSFKLYSKQKLNLNLKSSLKQMPRYILVLKMVSSSVLNQLGIETANRQLVYF